MAKTKKSLEDVKTIVTETKMRGNSAIPTREVKIISNVADPKTKKMNKALGGGGHNPKRRSTKEITL